MSLPILQPTSHASPETLVRLFHQTELNWARHLGEEHALDLGTALINPNLQRVAGANLILGARLGEGVSPASAMEAAEIHYREKGSRLIGLIPGPGPFDAMASHLLSTGWMCSQREILRLSRRPAASPMTIPADRKIIPARASFRHARELAVEMVRGDEQHLEAAMLHLDDPHVDALIALENGQAIASIAVLAMGEVGRIDLLYVRETHRRQGVGKLLLSRALEICARALFKHVLLAASPGETAAISLFRQFGFEEIGALDFYRLEPLPEEPQPVGGGG